MKKLVIADGHASMREGLRAAFTATGRYVVAGETRDPGLAETLCRELQPDLLLIDVCTEGENGGISAAERIKSRFPGIRIIVMTAYDDVSYLPGARRAGAEGFIHKSKSCQQFIAMADRVLEGEICFPEERTIPVLEGEAALTDRELQVLQLMCRNLSNEEIGEKLCISQSTVRFHKANLLAKTGFSRSRDLAYFMLSRGYFNPL